MTEQLKPTCDRKTKFWKGQKNTFGLLPGLEGTCPGATLGPGGCQFIPEGRKLPMCYVERSMSAYSGVKGVLEHNTRLLMSADLDTQCGLLDEEFDRFALAEKRREKKGEKPMLSYRYHWSGDIFDEQYAHALATTSAKHSNITFWGYTRSFFAVKHFAGIPNITLYLSLDPVNIHQGLVTYDEYKETVPNLRLCYMEHENNFNQHIDRAKDILTARQQLKERLWKFGNAKNYTKPDDWWAGLQLSECPADTGVMDVEYACSKCKGCITRDKAVWFKS
jgi:hypothetical protein